MRVEAGKGTETASFGDMGIQRTFAFSGTTETICAEIVAEEIWGGDFGGGVEAFKDEFVVFEGGCFEETVMEYAENYVVEAVGSRSHRQKLAGSEGGEDCDENLGMLMTLKKGGLKRLTSLGNGPIPVVVSTILSIFMQNNEEIKTNDTIPL